MAEIEQLIAGTVFASSLTPDVASKIDARDGILLFSVETTRRHVWHRFSKATFGYKSHHTSYIQSNTLLRQMRLQLRSYLKPRFCRARMWSVSEQTATREAGRGQFQSNDPCSAAPTYHYLPPPRNNGHLPYKRHSIP